MNTLNRLGLVCVCVCILPRYSLAMSDRHATKMDPEIPRTFRIFVRTFGPKMSAMPDFYAPIWAPSEAMSDFYADRSRLGGGRPLEANSEMNCDLLATSLSCSLLSPVASKLCLVKCPGRPSPSWPTGSSFSMVTLCPASSLLFSTISGHQDALYESVKVLKFLMASKDGGKARLAPVGGGESESEAAE
ncbi:hypothetical protein FA13DRAFT_1909649 [Coprinellus micaceus]|uniref:Uncharacterized protein n=1 Tax=Coprinellus micaceus TaxID=71717 RepID=A0A4Y7R504_COPMI|nr:hypothetical protein FA13DRAFT_1909649 [Coprinellus micaceus]